MDNSISIAFGTPEHGWLPVDFNYQDFHLNFDASDALNDPIEELYYAITKMQDNESRQITWWLEPGAYFFDIEKKGQNIILTISEIEDLHNEKEEKKTVLTITADNNQIIEPLRKALRQFGSQPYEENNWPYKLDESKIRTL